MSRLRVMLRGALISEIGLNPEKEYIGGRKEGSDIRLQAEKGISREHFKLKFSEGRWQVQAVSRFGDVFSLGQKVEQADLQHGQSFQIPPYEFTFLDVPDAGIGAGDEPQGAPASFGENDKTVIGAAPQVPYIKMVNSTGDVREMLRLEVGEVWVAGRDPSCQIIIPDQRVSRRQFEIYKVNGAYTILDLASVNGTFLNGSPVSSTDPQTLKSGDAINVLDNTMYFELHDPNFKYKVERIEIPPLQMDAPEEEFVEENFAQSEEFAEFAEEEIPEVEGYGVPEQISSQGQGPFTGMSGMDQQNPNQFYNFDAPPNQGPGEPPQEEPPKKGLAKLAQNKPMLLAVVLILLAGGYFLYDTFMPQTPSQVEPKVVEGNDPFSKLPPEKQKEVEELYSLADQMYNQQKYELAIEKIGKIKEILPGVPYKDSEKIETESQKALLTFIDIQKSEEIAREAEERAEKTKKIIAECGKKISPTITLEEMRQCLAEATSFDPNNSEIVKLMDTVQKMESDKKQKEEEKKSTESLIAEMKALFQSAEDVQATGKAFAAIKKYQIVTRSTLPDPDNLKKKAADRIAYIQSKIQEKSQGNLDAAEKLYREGKIKESVMTLRNSVVYDPENASIKEKIELYSLELKRQMRTIYQESIIDENYGLIDNTETKVGAKEKWKKITETDLEDGEYYRKAVIKLRRYGVM